MAKDGSEPRPIRWAAWIVTITGAITGVIAVVVFFWPSVKPAEPCRGARDGALGAPTIGDSVSYSGYLRIVGGSPGQASRARLRQLGKLIDLRVQTEGYKGKPLALRWWMVSGGGEPVTDPRLQNQLASVLRPADCKDDGAATVWAGPIPPGPGPFRVLIHLLDPQGGLLDKTRTPPFAGRRNAPSAAASATGAARAAEPNRERPPAGVLAPPSTASRQPSAKE